MYGFVTVIICGSVFLLFELLSSNCNYLVLLSIFKLGLNVNVLVGPWGSSGSRSCIVLVGGGGCCLMFNSCYPFGFQSLSLNGMCSLYLIFFRFLWN